MTMFNPVLFSTGNALMLPFLFFFLSVVATTVFLALWVYKDAEIHGENGTLWVLIILLVPKFLGILIYLFVGRGNREVKCQNCGEITSEEFGICGHCGEKLSKEFYRKHNKYGYLAIFFFALSVVIGFISIFWFGFSAHHSAFIGSFLKGGFS